MRHVYCYARTDTPQGNFMLSKNDSKFPYNVVEMDYVIDFS